MVVCWVGPRVESVEESRRLGGGGPKGARGNVGISIAYTIVVPILHSNFLPPLMYSLYRNNTTSSTSIWLRNRERQTSNDNMCQSPIDGIAAFRLGGTHGPRCGSTQGTYHRTEHQVTVVCFLCYLQISFLDSDDACEQLRGAYSKILKYHNTLTTQYDTLGPTALVRKEIPPYMRTCEYDWRNFAWGPVFWLAGRHVLTAKWRFGHFHSPSTGLNTSLRPHHNFLSILNAASQTFWSFPSRAMRTHPTQTGAIAIRLVR